MLKDLRLAQQAAEAADADTPLGASRRPTLYAPSSRMKMARARDFSAMLPRFEKLAVRKHRA